MWIQTISFYILYIMFSPHKTGLKKEKHRYNRHVCTILRYFSVIFGETAFLSYIIITFLSKTSFLHHFLTERWLKNNIKWNRKSKNRKGLSVFTWWMTETVIHRKIGLYKHNSVFIILIHVVYSHTVWFWLEIFTPQSSCFLFITSCSVSCAVSSSWAVVLNLCFL